MSKLNLWEFLYDKRLPEVYKTYDKESVSNMPLKRLMQVFGVGFGYMENTIDNISKVYDIDNCPAELLSHVADTIGFSFPYALTDREQRKFLKALPKLYKAKGTPRAFEYLAREIFGEGSSVEAYKATYKEGMSPKEWRKIYIEVSYNNEQFDLGKKQEYFRAFSELVRPVNTSLISILTGYLADKYNPELIDDQFVKDTITETIVEEPYNSKQISESYMTQVVKIDETSKLDGEMCLDKGFRLDDFDYPGYLAY